MPIFLRDAGRLYPYEEMPSELEKALQSIHAKSRQDNPEAYAKTDDIILQAEDLALQDDIFLEYKLFSLTRLLEAHTPKVILELGTGIATAIFADYVSRTQGTRLTSVDESLLWSEKVRSFTQIESGNPRYRLATSTKQDGQYGPVKASQYTNIPADEYDFVYVDGPMLPDPNYWVNSNVFDLIKDTPPKVIVVNQRFGTARILLNELKEKAQSFPADMMIDNLHQDYNYFSYFVCDSRQGGVANV